MANTTSLAQQLQSLATPQTSILDQKRDRRSVLFGPSEAANYGRDVYYDIGRSGFESLAKIDDRFAPFSESLFGRTSKDLQRAIEGREVNRRLDKDIERFLLLLSPYLQKEDALKAMEWLVYRFQVNDMNQRSLLMCIFPYYETALFARILQIMALSGTMGEWQWLSQCRKGNTVLPKLTVFTQWARKQAFRNFVAEYLRKMIEIHTVDRLTHIASSFYFTTVLGGLTHTGMVTEEHLASIMKTLPTCLASNHLSLISGSYLVFSYLCTHSTLSDGLIGNILKLMIVTHPPPPSLQSQCLLTLLTLTHHHPTPTLTPNTASHLTPLLKHLGGVARERSVASLVSPYVEGLLSDLLHEIKEDEDSEQESLASDGFDKLVDFLCTLPLSSSDAGKVIWSFIETIRAHLKPVLALRDVCLGKAMRRLETSHPLGYELATSKLVSRQNDPKDGRQYRKVLQVLLLPSAPSETPTFIQLAHPDPSVRLPAVRTYLKRLQRGVELKSDSTQIHVKYILSDDVPEIVHLALTTPQAIEALPMALVSSQCHELISRTGPEWHKVRTASMSVLCGDLVRRSDRRTEKSILSVCMSVILLARTNSDFALAKVALRSKVTGRSAFLTALKREVTPHLNTDSKVKNFSSQVWDAVPRVLASLTPSDLTSFWGVLDISEGQGHSQGQARSRVLSLALLHASLGSTEVRGHGEMKLGHMLLDGCLTLLECCKVSKSANANTTCWTNKQVSTSDLHSYCTQVGQGNLPVDLLMACILRSACLFNLPKACSNAPFWNLDMEEAPKEGHLLLLLKVLRCALKFDIQGQTEARNNILAKVLKECLPDPKAQFYLLALIWGWHPALPCSDIIDEALQIWTLTLGNSLLSLPSPPAPSLTLGPHSPLVPSLISSLTSATKSVRRGAVECLGALHSIRGGALTSESYMEVLKAVVEVGEEIVEDGSQLASLLASEDGSSGDGNKVTQKLLGLVLDEDTPMHIKAALLYTLTSNMHPTLLLSLLPLAEKLLRKTNFAKSDATKSGEVVACLDHPSSLCLLYILQRFTPKTTGVIETKDGWGVFKSALELGVSCLTIHDELMSPQSVLLKEVLTSRFLSQIQTDVKQGHIWALLVTLVTQADDPTKAGQLRHALRRVTLDAEVILGQIKELDLTPTKVTSIKEARLKRIKLKKASPATQEEGWSKLRLMLETIAVMSDLTRPWILVPTLQQCLKMTCDLDLTSHTLIQQLILSTLLHLLERSIEELGVEEVRARVQVSVEVIVQVIRSSLSQDTQRRALLLLAVCAKLSPEAVLHNIMAIFTFMGTSLLRRDDVFSFQVIDKTIQEIVPVIVKYNKEGEQGTQVEGTRLGEVCQVFIDTLPHLPHHRRLPLFTTLTTTLQPQRYLWLILALLADSYVMRGGPGGDEEEDKKSLPYPIQFSLHLSHQFDAHVQLWACLRLARLVSSLPDDKDGAKITLALEDKKKKMKKDINEEQDELYYLPLDTHTHRQIFYLKYKTTALIGYILASEKFIEKVYEKEQANEEEVKESSLHSLYQKLLEVTLAYLHDVTTACNLHQDKPAGRLYLSLQRKVVEVVEGVTALLPPGPLLRVTKGLFVSPVPLVRCKGAELLAGKLSHHYLANPFFRPDNIPALHSTLTALAKLSLNADEHTDTRQTYLYTTHLLIRYVHMHTHTHAHESIHLAIETAMRILGDEGCDTRVMTQALLVVGEGVGVLKEATVTLLQVLMPLLIKILSTTTTTTTTTTAATTQLQATLTTLHKVIDTLPQLLSPYVKDIVVEVCRVRVPDKEGKVAVRLLAVKDSLVKKVELRILMPRLVKAFATLLENTDQEQDSSEEDQEERSGVLFPILSLLTLLGVLVKELSAPNLNQHKAALMTLLTRSLDIRQEKGSSIQGLSAVEQATFASLSGLLLRLPELDNLAIFSSLITWPTGATPLRLITLYRFCLHLATTYKVLFLAAHLAEHLITPAADLIARMNQQDNIFGQGCKEAPTLTHTLLEAVLQTLQTVFAHDSIGFITQERFKILCTPLTGLIGSPVMIGGAEGGDVAYRRLVSSFLAPCLTSLAQAAGDDLMWRKMCGEVMKYLKEENEEVVLASLDVFSSLVAALGEDFLRPLLPDIIPPITEALESNSAEVEKRTQDVFTQMEDILGDALRTYMDF